MNIFEGVYPWNSVQQCRKISVNANSETGSDTTTRGFDSICPYGLVKTTFNIRKHPIVNRSEAILREWKDLDPGFQTRRQSAEVGKQYNLSAGLMK